MNAPSQAPALSLAHSAKPVTPRDRLIRLADVEHIVGFRKSQVYSLMRLGKFPRPIQIGRMSAWPESAVHQWVQDRIQEAQQ